MKKFGLGLLLFSVFFILQVGASVMAFEIITEEDVIRKTVPVTQLIPTADNFIVLFDSSGSMADTYRDTGADKVEAAKKILRQQNALIPDLGYNAALYLFTPFKTYYKMQPYDKAAYGAAIESLPTVKNAGYGDMPTPLTEGIMELEPILQKTFGRTAIFVFTDGTYTRARTGRQVQRGQATPLEAAKKIVANHNACFYFISSATTAPAKKFLDDMAAVNECSRVTDFDRFYDNPVIGAGALYVVKSTMDVETITETRIAGAKLDDLLFSFDSTDILPKHAEGLNKLGAFLESNSGTYAVFAGFTDTTGPREYNLHLSRRRVESAMKYLMENFNLDASRFVLFWYGPENPVASNDTAAGRALNRRVEVAVGGLE